MAKEPLLHEMLDLTTAERLDHISARSERLAGPEMTRFLSWSGWIVGGCMILAAIVVGYELKRDPHHPHAPIAHALPLGATLVSVDRGGGRHLVVNSLQTGGPGSAAGLRVGDVIEDVDGLPAPTVAAFDRDVASGSYTDVDLRIRRGAALLDIHLKRQAGASA